MQEEIEQKSATLMINGTKDGDYRLDYSARYSRTQADCFADAPHEREHQPDGQAHQSGRSGCCAANRRLA